MNKISFFVCGGREGGVGLDTKKDPGSGCGSVGS